METLGGSLSSFCAFVLLLRRVLYNRIPVFALSFSCYEESYIHNMQWTLLTRRMKHLTRKLMHFSDQQVFFAFLGFF